MKTIFTSQDILAINRVHDALKAEGIDAAINGEYLSVFGTSPKDLWPSISVPEEDETRAKAIADELGEPVIDPSPTWTCLNCGEVLEGQFSVCWKCQYVREL